MKLVYLPEARIEVLAAVTYYHSCADRLAADFFRHLQKAEHEILEWPEFWRPVGGGFRRKLLERFPYAMIYHQLPEDVLEVVAVMHQKRRPDYWRKRGNN